MKYNQWLDIWLENYVKPTSKMKTYAAYKQIVEKDWSQDWGIRTEWNFSRNITMLRNWIVATRKLNYGYRIIGEYGERYYNRNSKLSETCLYDRWVRKVYCRQNKTPENKRKEVSCFTAAEQKKIERAVLADKRQKMFGIVLCLYTGLRIGELLALTWKDIDFIKGVLSVNKTIHDGKDENGRFAALSVCRKRNRPCVIFRYRNS